MSVHLGILEVQEAVISAREHVKFYQVGSYAVGSRFAEEDYRSLQSDPNRWNTLTSDHRARQGCGEALGIRYALDSVIAAGGGDTITMNAMGYLEVFFTSYPESVWTLPWLYSPFGNAPTAAVRAAAGLTAEGKMIRTIAQGGDGGAADIDIGCLPDMFEYNDDVLYVCCNNQARINTGVQRSGATPSTVRTAVTQSVGPNPGNRFGRDKDMARVVMVHEIPYVVTMTVADLRDLRHKVKKTMNYHGACYIHVLIPCPLGWGAASSITVKLAQLVTQIGLFPVSEAEGGEITSATKIRRPAPVEEYLRPQRHFTHLFKGGGDAKILARLQTTADRNIRRYGLVDEKNLDEGACARVLLAPEDPERCYEHTLHTVLQTKQRRAEATALAEAFESGGPTTQIRRSDIVVGALLCTNAPEQE